MQIECDRPAAMDAGIMGRKRPAVSVIRFTPMESKVLKGVEHGHSNKQIAYDLGIAKATAKAHMTALVRKLTVCNRTQAALMLRWCRGSGQDPTPTPA